MSLLFHGIPFNHKLLCHLADVVSLKFKEFFQTYSDYFVDTFQELMISHVQLILQSLALVWVLIETPRLRVRVIYCCLRIAKFSQQCSVRVAYCKFYNYIPRVLSNGVSFHLNNFI